MSKKTGIVIAVIVIPILMIAGTMAMEPICSIPIADDGYAEINEQICNIFYQTTGQIVSLFDKSR